MWETSEERHRIDFTEWSAVSTYLLAVLDGTVHSRPLVARLVRLPIGQVYFPLFG